MEFNLNPELVVATVILVGVLAQLLIPALDPKRHSKE